MTAPEAIGDTPLATAVIRLLLGHASRADVAARAFSSCHCPFIFAAR